MALPKRKTSRARRNKRRSHHRLATPTLTPCPNPQCDHWRLQHQVCPACGYYRGRLVFAPKEKKKKS